nr:MAG TPA: CRISPR-associated protein [Caudoviricetes sp.]
MLLGELWPLSWLASILIFTACHALHLLNPQR